MTRCDVLALACLFAAGAGRADGLPPEAVARLGTDAFQPKHLVFGLRFRPDGRTLVAVNCHGHLIRWAYPSGVRDPKSVAVLDDVLFHSLSPDGTMVVNPRGFPVRVAVLDTDTGKER